MFVKVRILTRRKTYLFSALVKKCVFLPVLFFVASASFIFVFFYERKSSSSKTLLLPCVFTPLFLFCLPLKALDRKEKKHPPDEKDMAGFWTTFLHREPIVVWSCALGLVGAALPICVPPVRNMLRSDAEPTRPPSAASVVAALRGGKS